MVPIVCFRVLLTVVKMEEKHKKILQDHFGKFVKTVDAVALLPYLPCLSDTARVSKPRLMLITLTRLKESNKIRQPA